MIIKDFFNELQIKYQPIEIEIYFENGIKKKRLLGPKEFNPELKRIEFIFDSNDKDNLSDEEFRRRNENYSDMSHLAGHTDKRVCVIDVDFEDDYKPPLEVCDWLELMKSLYPYKKSTRKKNGLHIYFINNGAIEVFGNRMGHTPYKHIEILCGSLVFEDKNSEILNFTTIKRMTTNDLQIVELNDPIEIVIEKPVKKPITSLSQMPLVKLTKVDNKKLKGDELEAYNIISDWILSLTKIDEYKEWFETLVLIKHLVGDKYKSVADELSHKSSNYGRFNETWDKITYNDYCDPFVDFYTIFQDSMVINSFDTGNDYYIYDRDSKLWRSDKKHSRLVYFLTIVIKSIVNDKKKRIDGDKDELQKTLSPSEFVEWEKKMELFLGILGSLKKETRTMFVKSTIERKMKNQIVNVDFDNIDYLYHFRNITLDLRDKSFRERRKEDYCSMYACYLEYSKDEKGNPIPKHKDRVELWKSILNDIHEEEEVRNNFIDIVNCSFSGKVLSKFVIFNGNGSNGKSFLTSILRELHGDYGVKGNINTLTSKTSSGATPEIAKLSKKRWKIFAEPEESSRIYFSIVKDITGDSEIDSRKLYSNDCKTIMAGVNILECNRRLKIDGITDYSMARRLVDCLFKSCFRDKGDIKEGTTYKVANKEYLEKDWTDKMISSLFWFLYEKMRTYKELHNFKLCKSIVDRTKEYIENSNDLLQTIKRYAEEKGEEGSYITLTEIINSIKNDRDYFENLTKKDKREWTSVNLKKRIEEDPQLKACFKKKHRVKTEEGKDKDYYNVLLGWSFCSAEGEEEEEETKDCLLESSDDEGGEIKSV